MHNTYRVARAQYQRKHTICIKDGFFASQHVRQAHTAHALSVPLIPACQVFLVQQSLPRAAPPWKGSLVSVPVYLSLYLSLCICLSVFVSHLRLCLSVFVSESLTATHTHPCTKHIRLLSLSCSLTHTRAQNTSTRTFCDKIPSMLDQALSLVPNSNFLANSAPLFMSLSTCFGWTGSGCSTHSVSGSKYGQLMSRRLSLWTGNAEGAFGWQRVVWKKLSSDIRNLAK